MKVSQLHATGPWNASGRFHQEAYEKNLLGLKAILDKYNVRFCLAFGTLLGAVREQGFIKGDTDTDLFTTQEYNEKLADALSSKEFAESGFTIIRIIGDELITISRDDSYIDISIFSEKPDSDEMIVLHRHTIKRYMVHEAQKFTFLGQEFLVPKDAELYLTEKYGDWKTPSGRHATT